MKATKKPDMLQPNPVVERTELISAVFRAINQPGELNDPHELHDQLRIALDPRNSPSTEGFLVVWWAATDSPKWAGVHVPYDVADAKSPDFSLPELVRSTADQGSIVIVVDIQKCIAFDETGLLDERPPP